MVDSYFEIGNSHVVCQDYALHGIIGDMQYGIIADGCSNAEHSEIGAQILCHVARYYMALYYHTGLFRECTIDTLSLILGNSILKRADDLRKLYPITPTALQATLLIIVAIQKEIFLFVWGDGVIIERYKTSENLITKIDYSANAPFYLVTDKKKYKEFLLKDKNTEPQKIIETFRIQNSLQISHSVTEESPFYLPYTFKILDYNSIISITVSTDGILSYQDKNKNPIDLSEIIPDFIQFKSINGEFIKRRMSFFKKTMQKKEWFHYDDIATTTIIF